MFEYESEILTLLRENEDSSLLEKVKQCKEVFVAYKEVKMMCSEQICKIFVIASTTLLLLGIFSMQVKVSPIGIGFLAFGGIGMIFSLTLFFVCKIDAENWLDLLSEKDIEELNQFIEKECIQIVEKDEIVYLSRKKRTVEKMNSIDF